MAQNIFVSRLLINNVPYREYNYIMKQWWYDDTLKRPNQYSLPNVSYSFFPQNYFIIEKITTDDAFLLDSGTTTSTIQWMENSRKNID